MFYQLRKSRDQFGIDECFDLFELGLVNLFVLFNYAEFREKMHQKMTKTRKDLQFGTVCVKDLRNCKSF